MGENHFENIPVAIYGINLSGCAISYTILQKTSMAHYKHNTSLTEALKKQEQKGTASLALYIISTISAWFYPLVSAICTFTLTTLQVFPDKTIEKAIQDEQL